MDKNGSQVRSEYEYEERKTGHRSVDRKKQVIGLHREVNTGTGKKQ